MYDFFSEHHMQGSYLIKKLSRKIRVPKRLPLIIVSSNDNTNSQKIALLPENKSSIQSSNSDEVRRGLTALFAY